jgi:hypothetical protein
MKPRCRVIMQSGQNAQEKLHLLVNSKWIRWNFRGKYVGNLSAILSRSILLHGPDTRSSRLADNLQTVA